MQSTTTDPFLGKCIHGSLGAKYSPKAGGMRSSDCGPCKKMDDFCCRVSCELDSK